MNTIRLTDKELNTLKTALFVATDIQEKSALQSRIAHPNYRGTHPADLHLAQLKDLTDIVNSARKDL